MAYELLGHARLSMSFDTTVLTPPPVAMPAPKKPTALIPRPSPRPAALVRLHAETVRILNSPDVQRVLSNDGLETIANSPAEFAAMIEQDAKIWNAAADSAGLVSQ